MDNFEVGDIVSHKETNKKWLITKISDGIYYLKGLDRRLYLQIKEAETASFLVVIKGKRLQKEIYG